MLLLLGTGRNLSGGSCAGTAAVALRTTPPPKDANFPSVYASGHARGAGGKTLGRWCGRFGKAGRQGSG